jgi:hypothetical protein
VTCHPLVCSPVGGWLLIVVVVVVALVIAAWPD